MLLLNVAINNSRIIKDCFSVHGEEHFVGNKLIYTSVICLFVCYATCVLDDAMLDPMCLLPSA